MIIYPAIDLRGGQVVRLKEGDPNRQTIFSNSPLDIAQRWHDEGATWMHMVNLDGAFGEASQNLNILKQVASKNVNVQFGGGLRSLVDIETALELGAKRVVLGTIAIKQPSIVEEAVHRFGAEYVCVGLDAKDGKIATHGWQTLSDLTPIELGQKMVEMGVKHALYTDVSRDGLLSGVNVTDTVALAEKTHLHVIASGGVSTLDDIRQLRDSGRVAGAIIGMALYTGQFTLADAIRIVSERA